VERMKQRAIREGRHDDADEGVIRHRFEVYEQETSPVLGEYAASKIFEILAAGTPAEVLLRILEKLVPRYTASFSNPLG